MPIRRKLKAVAEAVFGLSHLNVKLLFEKCDRPSSLTDIRDSIVHGSSIPLRAEDVEMVGTRLYDMATVSRAFLVRLIFDLKPSEPLPGWSGKHRVSLSMDDPRSILATTDERMLSGKDWRIRGAWVP